MILSRPRRRIAHLLAVVLVGAGVSAALPARSSPPVATGHVAFSEPQLLVDPGAWTRYPAEDFTSPAGDLCDFPLRSRVVFDKVFVRTTARFDNGDPRRQEFSGPLVVRLTNLDSSMTVRRDLSAYAIARYRRDGGYSFAIYGPAAVGFRSADSLPRGYYVLGGRHVVSFDPSGVRTLVVDRGSKENVCHTLTDH